jgi:hypothetical protein
MHRLLLALVLASCGGSGPPDTSSDTEPDTIPDTEPDTTPDTTPDVPEDAPLLSGVSFVEKGSPGHPVITDLEVFRDRLYVTTSVNPLGDFGASVFHTTDGATFTRVLDDPSSQGYLRIRAIDDRLYVPDGDPNGYDPSYVYISSNGDDFTRSTVTGSVHTFDVIRYNGDYLTSNGMMSGAGSLCRSPDAGLSPWTEVVSTSFSRLKYMAQAHGRLFAAKRAVGSTADYVTWTSDISAPTPVDAVSGEAITWRWYATSSGRLFWSLAAGSTLSVMYTDDGETWIQVPTLSGEFVSDFAELDGNLYVLASSGLLGSTDETHFTPIAPSPSPETFGPVAVPGGYNAEACASMTLYGDHLWAGSSNNGHLYRVE